MSSNNPNYTYPRPQQQPQQHPSVQNHTHIQQSFSHQGNYGVSRGGGDVGSGGGASSASGRAEYAAERWPDYGAPQQHHGQYSPGLQHVQGMASLGSAVPRPSSRTADVAPSSINSRTSTASPVPGRAVGAFNGGGSGGGGGAVGVGMAVGGGGGGYDQYTGAHYPSQPSATTATANQGSSRTVTAGASFGGYNNYGPHYTQSQPPTTIAEMQQQQQLRTAPQQRVAVPEYIDYTAAAASSTHTHTHTPATTVSQNYTPLYQTADSIRTQQATSLYTPTPVYQNAAAAGTAVPSSYEGTYTPVDPQSQRQQQHRPRQPQAQPAAPAQQPGKQKQQPRAPQFQAVNQQQSHTSQFQAVKSPQYQQPAPAAMTQYSNAFSQQQQHQQQHQHQQHQQQQQQQQQEQPAIQRTPTPSSVAAPYHQPAPVISSQIQHTHVTPSQLHSPQLQSPQIHSPQMQTQSPHQAPTQPQTQPQAQIQQQQYQAPPPPSEPPTQKKAKPKSRAKTWEPTMPMLYRQALHQGHNYMPSEPAARGLAGGGGDGGGVKTIDPQREQEQRQLIEAQAKRIEADMQARKKAEYEQQARQQAYQEAQKRAHEAQQRAQQEQQARQQEAQLQENERQRQEQEHMRVLHARQRQLEQQAGQEAHQMQAQIEAQYQANLQAQHQQQQQQQQTEQHAQAPPQQANQVYPENQNYQAPPQEARPAAPPALNKELMEAQMKIMVERMRYYQSADPITFQQVWENVRKSGGGNNAGAITSGSASGAIMTRDGSASSGSSEDRKQHSNNINTFQQQQPVQSANTNTNDSVTAPAPPPPAPAPALAPPAAAAVVAPVQQPAPAPAPVVAAPPAPASLRSPGIIDIKTARAIGKYLLNHFGHSPPQATILELILSGTSFIVLCDRLEVMGYKPHRGNFSRFLLAEVDGGEDAEEEQAEVEVVEIDAGESRVLGEVEDDQEQILRELNEARRSSPVVVEDVASATPERTVVTAAGAGSISAAGAGSISAAGAGSISAAGEAGIKAKRARGRPRKSTTQPQPQPQTQTQTQTQSAVEAEEPKTPSADEETATVVSSLPTPPSVAAVAFPPTSTFTAPPPLQQQQQQQQSPQSPLTHTNTNTTSLHTSNTSKSKQFMPPLSGNITSHSTPSPEDMSSAEYIARKYVPRRPTPQSVKARAAAAPILAERQFVAPPQIYRPPTPPRMVVDLEQDGTDVEMLDPPAPAPAPAPGSESGSGSERLIVKLRVQKPAASAPVPAPVPNPASATIDLTGTTPEPPAAHNHSHNQYHHGMPAFGELCEADLEWGKSTHEASPDKRPVLIPIPIPLQPPAPAQAQAQGPAWVEPLIEPLKREKALVKHTYNPSTIARDILIVMGRHPEFRALNAHLDSLRTIAGNEVDLTTVRWDLLDPGPELVSFGDDMAMEVGDMADDEGEGGVAVVARAVPAASAAAKSLVKGKGVVAPPVAAGKERKKKRASGSVLGASVASFGAHGGFTTAAGGSGGGGGGGAGSGSGNNNNTTAAPASASAETPRTQTRAGNNNGGSTARTASTLRTVMTPDAAAASSSSRNFSVIIQSPRAPTSGPSRPTPTTTTTTTNTLKRKSTSHSPAPKKPARLRRTKARDDPPPSGFKVFKCRWEHCPAELHNFETLHAHVAHNHGKPDNGVYSCRWAGCSRPAPTAAKRRGTGAAGGTYLLEFDAKEPWQRHMDEAHLDAVRRELGVGPAVGLYDRDAAVASDVDYLSDSRGRQVTPIARPAPEGYVFLPPPQVANRHLVRARLLGAGMEGDDDMEGIADRAAEASLGVRILRISRPDGAEGRAGGSSSGGASGSGSGGGGGQQAEGPDEDGWVRQMRFTIHR